MHEKKIRNFEMYTFLITLMLDAIDCLPANTYIVVGMLRVGLN